jgi:diaminopimelate decarboxylase
MFTEKEILFFNTTETPFYYYDTDLLQKTIDVIKTSAPTNYHIHYALKANAHPDILAIIKNAGFGADCVSGNEVRRAVECGFDQKSIVFAGVGKSDKEINYALDQGIFCFNVESIQEMEVLNSLAGAKQRKADIALRINPNIDAFTHKYITTGLEENKFGINPHEFEDVLTLLAQLPNLNFTGLHFHIGSQITDLQPFKNLCSRVNEINRWFKQKGFSAKHINLGGGLGINYQEPDTEAIVDFKCYFDIFKLFLQPDRGQEIHFELGRSVIAQCGSLISRVLYIKNGINTNFVILDGGMTELMRPALYQAYHKIENISNGHSVGNKKYDVVGPICESSDCFGKAVTLPETRRGDLVAIRSTGAYGQTMSNAYNLRDAANSYFSDQVVSKIS